MSAGAQRGASSKATALVQQGLQLIVQGRYEEALHAEERALAISPKDPNAHSYRGSALLRLGRIEEALAAYDTVLRLAPHAAVAHYNRANALRCLNRLDEALTSVRQALKRQPHYPDALSLAGMILNAMGAVEDALAHYDAALQISPEAADAHYNKALALLTLGRLREAWPHYEWRLRWDVTIRTGQSRSVDRAAPDWDGRVTAKPLLVIPEQGLGDQIFYAGMLDDLQQRLPGSTVCLEPRLLPLFARSFPKLHFCSPYDIDSAHALQAGTYGAQTHLGSLGRFFRNDASDMARIRTPYLVPDAARVGTLRERLHHIHASKGRVICGISWVSKNAEFGAEKSLSLNALAPVLQLPGVDFIDLQYSDTSDERARLQADTGITVHKLDDIDSRNDLDALAALIDACDLVLTVSNTTAHIAAALGKPTVILLHNAPSLFWYWHRQRNDSPWYPSAVLLRQTQAGDWHSVIPLAAAAVEAFISERSS